RDSGPRRRGGYRRRPPCQPKSLAVRPLQRPEGAGRRRRCARPFPASGGRPPPPARPPPAPHGRPGPPPPPPSASGRSGRGAPRTPPRAPSPHPSPAPSCAEFHRSDHPPARLSLRCAPGWSRSRRRPTHNHPPSGVPQTESQRLLQAVHRVAKRLLGVSEGQPEVTCVAEGDTRHHPHAIL